MENDSRNPAVYNTAVVKHTYVKVLIVQAVVLAGLWLLQQAFL